MIEKSLNGEILNTYIYGADNRLKKSSNRSGEHASYSYNGLGRRVSRRADNTEIDYILDQTKMYNNLLEADGDSFVWDENNLLFRNHETEVRDRLGSPIGMDEFGALTNAGSLGFTGYMYDDISGTYFAQAREYVPEVGRFAGRDIVKGIIQQPITLNNYHYCYSNPMKYVDLDGCVAELTNDAFNIGKTLNSKKGGTYSTGVTVGGSYVTTRGSLSAGVIVDSQGNVAIAFSASYGVGETGIGASAGKYSSWTDANSIYDVDGKSDFDVEGSIISPVPEVPVAVSGEYSRFTDDDGEKRNGVTINKGVGVELPTDGLPVSVSLGKSRTWIIKIGNVKNRKKGSLD